MTPDRDWKEEWNNAWSRSTQPKRDVPCDRCKRDFVFTPLPTQAENEDFQGFGWLGIPEWAEGMNPRFVPETPTSQSMLFITKKPGERRSYGECPRCRAEGEIAAAAWNGFMGRSAVREATE